MFVNGGVMVSLSARRPDIFSVFLTDDTLFDDAGDQLFSSYDP